MADYWYPATWTTATASTPWYSNNTHNYTYTYVDAEYGEWPPAPKKLDTSDWTAHDYLLAAGLL